MFNHFTFSVNLPIFFIYFYFVKQGFKVIQSTPNSNKDQKYWSDHCDPF